MNRAFAVLLMILVVMLEACSNSTTTPSQDSILNISPTSNNELGDSTPTDSIIPTGETPPTVTTGQEAVEGISGLTRDEVIKKLEEKGFYCAPIPSKWSFGYRAECIFPVDGSVVVLIDSKDEEGANLIRFETDTLAPNPTETQIQIITESLILMASLPYRGSKPDEAKKWIESRLRHDAAINDTMAFGGVKYELQGRLSETIRFVMGNDVPLQ